MDTKTIHRPKSEFLEKLSKTSKLLAALAKFYKFRDEKKMLQQLRMNKPKDHCRTLRI